MPGCPEIQSGKTGYSNSNYLKMIANLGKGMPTHKMTMTNGSMKQFTEKNVPFAMISYQ
jgi:hypothetical protein